MSLINTQIKPFKATAYHGGKFVPVSDADLKGQWSVVFFYPADFTFVCPTELGDLAEQYEAGVRGNLSGWQYEAVAYLLNKQDDLLGQRDANGVTVQTNNGSTRHKGVKLGLGRQLAAAWRLDAAASYAVHRYVAWVGSGVDYSGKEVEASPRLMSPPCWSGPRAPARRSWPACCMNPPPAATGPSSPSTWRRSRES